MSGNRGQLIFDELRAEIERLEGEHPEMAIQLLETPISAATSSGNRAPLLRRAVLRRVVLKRQSGEIWVELGEGSWNRSTAVWNPAVMRVGVPGLRRDGRPRVEFEVVEL